MSRARSLKPGFFRNPELATVSPLTRIFFQGLWCEADRRGIVEDRPKKLKVDILPYDKANVEEMLKNLESLGFIQRYEVDGVRCIFIVNFERHQNPHRDEKANTLPAPCQHSVDTVPTPNEHPTNTPLTLNPITDSLNPEPRTSSPPTPSAEGESPKPKPTRSVKTPIPEDLGELIPPETWAAIRSEQQLTDDQLRFETSLMVDHFRGKGERRPDWVASWRKWMRSEYRQSKPKPPDAFELWKTPGGAAAPPDLRRVS